MLPAANRLRTAADFRQTTRRGTKVSRGSVVVYAAPGDPGLAPRAGLIVGRSVGGSVQRHRAARRIRGALRTVISEVPQGSLIVVRALPGADTAPGLPADVMAAVRAAASRRGDR